MAFRWLWYLLPAVLGVAVACGREGQGPVTAPTQAPTLPPTQAASQTQDQPLPRRDVTFVVHLPGNTPPDEAVYVRVLPFDDWAWRPEETAALKPQGGGLWTGSLPVDEGGLVRYVYDRWDGGDWSRFKDMREASGGAIIIESRHLLMTPDVTRVEDVVETWNDRRGPASTGVIRGTVVDGATGSPLMDTNISIGGIHIATDHSGRFELERVATGSQRVTAFRNAGDYLPIATKVTVTEGATAEARIEMKRARAVEVTFDVGLPADTPPEAEIRLAGNVFQAGARPGVQPTNPVMAGRLLLPRLERLGNGRARTTLSLHEGTYLQYFYTVGSSSRGREYGGEGQYAYRSLVVDGPSQTRHDQVKTWRPGTGSVQITLRLTVPPNTAPGTPIAFNAGPSHWMTQTGAREWTFFLYGFPGQREDYRFVLGDDGLGWDGSPGLGEDGLRTFVYPASDAVLRHQVVRWKYSPEVMSVGAGGVAEVTFRVSVPPDTARDATVRIVGNTRPLQAGITMSRDAANPWMRQTTVSLPVGEDIVYWYEKADAAAIADRKRSLAIRYHPIEINDWVVAWPGSPTNVAGVRAGFLTGIYTPDFWSDGFLNLSPETMERIKAHNGGWVVVSSVWHFGRLDPPLVESRRVLAPSVLTPREDILAQARIAREKGLKILLGPQFNMEMLPNGPQAICRTQTREWLEAWLVEAEKMWMWNASVAEEAGAEAMLLPGYCFHVFNWMDESDPYTAEFDRKVSALIEKVRQVFHGKLIVSGDRQELAFPGFADMVGVTTYGTGHPDLPYDASVEEWRAAYDALFAGTVDPLYQRWGKPVLFYTVHLPPITGDPTHSKQGAQAARLEAIFQALKDRPWVVGTFMWDYAMVDAPLNPEAYGVRGRQGEAVLAKYYGMWGGSGE